MDDKIVLGLFALCLVLSGITGYSFFQMNTQQTQLSVIIAEKISFQTQVSTLLTEKITLQEQVTSLTNEKNGINNQLSVALSQVSALNSELDLLKLKQGQSNTQVRIDAINWGMVNTDFTVNIRNIGITVATIESINIRQNCAGAATITTKLPANGLSYDAGAVRELSVSFPFGRSWEFSTSYVVRVTTTTGFYYEAVVTTPSY